MDSGRVNWRDSERVAGYIVGVWVGTYLVSVWVYTGRLSGNIQEKWMGI